MAWRQRRQRIERKPLCACDQCRLHVRREGDDADRNIGITRVTPRIGEGIENGSLNAKEAGKLESKEAKVNKQERRMRADGDMTQKEKAKVNREQNQLSRNIYQQKHDKQRRSK